jgi:hypothetical protein
MDQFLLLFSVVLVPSLLIFVWIRDIGIYGKGNEKIRVVSLPLSITYVN